MNEASPLDPLTHFTHPELQAILDGGNTYQASGLDRGERNDAPLKPGVLAEKEIPFKTALGLLKEAYGCDSHGSSSEERFCYLPSSGEFKGQHIRFDATITRTRIAYMVSTSIIFPCSHIDGRR